MMTIFDPLSAGLMTMCWFLLSCVKALRSSTDRLSGISVGGRKDCRARLLVVIICFVLSVTWVSSGSQLEGKVKSDCWVQGLVWK